MRISVVLLILLLGGCSKPFAETQDAKEDLQAIVKQYRQFADSKQMSPKGPEELLEAQSSPAAASGSGQEAASRCARALQSKNYVVIWSYNILKDPRRDQLSILAYHKDVPKNGGYTAFGDGAVRLLDKAEFDAIDKAQPSK